jgi:hypothetical protein
MLDDHPRVSFGDPSQAPEAHFHRSSARQGNPEQGSCDSGRLQLVSRTTSRLCTCQHRPLKQVESHVDNDAADTFWGSFLRS